MSRRCILLSTRTNKDKETNDELLFLSLARLPSKSSRGGLWYPKQSELLVTACINKTRKPDDFESYSKLNPGTLIDVTFGINDFNGKVIVANLDVIEGTNIFDPETLYT